jgi:hypothetical protein
MLCGSPERILATQLALTADPGERRGGLAVPAVDPFDAAERRGAASAARRAHAAAGRSRRAKTAMGRECASALCSVLRPDEGVG